MADSFSRRDGQDKIYKMAKQAKKDKKDIVGCKFIIGADNFLKTDEGEVRDVWKEYYSNLLNVENYEPWNHFFAQLVH